ncbi:MAG: LysM peptidoglycan-binding domain-containing protein [Saprospiraceae bacterium]|nr:LysM peptidoglycan-binding domain-containing protein [Saprospiraceae bacterium]
MKKAIWLAVALLTGTNIWSQEQDFRSYIEKYKDIAVREMERAGIPASIKLAQGLLESNAGKSPLARHANNHFGIKCGNDWKGKTYSKEDDEYDANGKLVKSCFRVYKSDEASFVAHSEFLRDPLKNNRYGFLFMIDPTDYKRWAYGLKRAGYATSATYPEKLIGLIERYELQKYDRVSTIDFETPAEEVMVGILSVNDVKYVLSDSSETLADIARRTDVSLRSLIHYNEHIVDEGKAIPEGTKVFLQPKRKSYRGRQTWHYVKPGENMRDISMNYALNLVKLYKRNRMTLGTEPAVNERVKLRGSKPKNRPRLSSEGAIPTPVPDQMPKDKDVDGLLEMEVEGNNTTTKPNDKYNSPPVQVEPEPTLPVITPQKPPAQPQVVPAPPATQTVQPPLTEDPFNANETPPTNTNTTTDTPPAPDSPQYHTVIKGDTLWNISQRYGTSVDELRRLNNMANNNIQLGQRLRVK